MKKLQKTASRVFERTKQDSIGGRAAALAYYMIFALVPVLILLISAFGFFYTEESIKNRIVGYFTDKLGEQGGVFFQRVLDGISNVEVNTIASIIGVFVILYAATNLFGHLQNTFAMIFRIGEIKESNVIKKTIKKRLLAFSYMVVLFALIFAVVLGNIYSSLLFQSIREVISTPMLSGAFHVAQYTTTLMISILIFTAIYRFASDSKMSWKNSFLGAVVAGILFSIINTALGLYLSFSDSFSAYGAAGFFIAFLLWFYYVSVSLFLGAEVTTEFENIDQQHEVREPKTFWGRLKARFYKKPEDQRNAS